jgi:hypothetical protein
MKYAVIENGKVINIVISEPDFAANQGWIECSEKGGIGWDYDGTNFIDNRPIVIEPTIPVPTREELLQQLQILTQQIQSLT